MSQYACDFETSTLKWNKEKTWVWSWGFEEIGKPETFTYGRTIDEFMNWALSKSKKLFFHNLKFDGSFIISYLLNNGYTYNPLEKEKGMKRKPILKDMEFSTLIDNSGMWYSIEIKKGRNKIVKIFDSLKKIPLKISEIAQAFDLEMLKGDIDYDKIRSMDEPLDFDDLDYLRNDVGILSSALNEVLNKNNMPEMTISGSAFNSYKRSLVNDIRDFDMLPPKKQKEMINNRFRAFFPTVSLEVDAFLRDSYGGGMTQVKPGMEGKEVWYGLTLDVNSMYPSILRDKLLPYGRPVWYEGEYEEDKRYPLYIAEIKFHFKVKENHLPTIQIKGSNRYTETEYLKTDGGEPYTFTLTSVEWETIQKQYDVWDVEFKGGYKFKAKIGMFADYIKYWGYIKETTKGGQRQLAKLMLNSLYGKFGTSPLKTSKDVFLNPHDGSLQFKEGNKDEGEPIYVAVASFVTAYGRELLTDTIMSCYDRFLYCDTDSIHIQGTEIPETMKDKVHSTELGYWDLENTFIKGVYLRAKTYFEVVYAKTKEIVEDGIKKVIKVITNDVDNANETVEIIKCAGMPDNLKDLVTWDTFKVGLVIKPCKENNWTGKLVPKQLDGGVVLIPRSFAIK